MNPELIFRNGFGLYNPDKGYFGKKNRAREERHMVGKVILSLLLGVSTEPNQYKLTLFFQWYPRFKPQTLHILYVMSLPTELSSREQYKLTPNI